MNSFFNLIYFETIQENSRIWAHKTATPDIRNVKLLNTEWHNSTYYGLRMLNKFKNIQTYHLAKTLLNLCIIFLWKIDDVSKYDSYGISQIVWTHSNMSEVDEIEGHFHQNERSSTNRAKRKWTFFNHLIKMFWVK